MVGVWRGRGEENMAGDGRRCGETEEARDRRSLKHTVLCLFFYVFGKNLKGKFDQLLAANCRRPSSRRLISH